MTGDGRLLVAVGATTGALLSGFPVTVSDDLIRVGSPILVELDEGAPGAEILVGDNQGAVHGFRGDGSRVRGFPFSAGGRISHGLSLWDLDENGAPDLLVQAEQFAEIGAYGIDSVEFPPDEDEARARNPWPSFRRDERNTGCIPITRGSASSGIEEPASGGGIPQRLRLLGFGSQPSIGPCTVSFETPGGRHRLVIVDATGRVVRVLADEDLAPGAHVRAWDGRDDRGRVRGSGVYWLLMEGGGGKLQEKIVRLR